MTEVKKVSPKRAKSTKSAPNADLVEMATASAAEIVDSTLDAAPALDSALPKAEPIGPGITFSSVREQSDAFRKAMGQAVTVSAQGALEVNDKIIDALNSQSNAALELWRTAISPSPLPEAFRLQTSATRQAYEAASAQWRDIAETTARWFTRSLEPLQSALQR